MSSAVVSTSAALRRHFIFDEESGPVHVGTATLGRPVERSSTAGARIVQSIGNKKSSIPLAPASRLEVRPAPEKVSSGIAELDALTGGLPRGCLTEICGPASSGRTSLLLTALAAATRRGEFCALVDAGDALDPHSVAAAGVEMDRLLWVRCGDASPQRHRSAEKNRIKPKDQIHFSNAKQETENRIEQVLRATDLLLESGGFGLIALDLADLPPQIARCIPLTTWFRFRRAIEHTPTIMLAIEQQPIAGSCSSLLLQLGSKKNPGAKNGRTKDSWKPAGPSREAAECDSPARQCGVEAAKKNEPCRDDTFVDDTVIANPPHVSLLTGLEINAELICSRLERKPASSVAFATKTAWAG